MDVRGAVRPGQHEHAGEGVVGTVLVVEGVADALGVVVVDEDGGLAGGHVAPALTEVPQIGKVLVLEDPLEVAGVAELLDVAVAEVFGRGDGLAGAVDRLLLPINIGVGQPGLDVGEVGSGHVLGGVDPEPVDAQRQQVVEVGGDPPADVVLAGVEVGELDELAVLDVRPVLVVGNGGPAVVHIGTAVNPGVVVLGIRGPARPGPVTGGHVVDDGIGDDLHPGAMTRVDHGLERGPVTEPPGDLVAHGLVRGPPLGPLDMLLRRRYLDVPVPGGPERIGTGLGNRLELPLKQNGGDVLVTGGSGARLRRLRGEGRNGEQGSRTDSCRSGGSDRHVGGLLAGSMGIVGDRRCHPRALQDLAQEIAELFPGRVLLNGAATLRRSSAEGDRPTGRVRSGAEPDRHQQGTTKPLLRDTTALTLPLPRPPPHTPPTSSGTACRGPLFRGFQQMPRPSRGTERTVREGTDG